jgi:hypothetical protein
VAPPNFDDSAWQSGPGGFGTPGTPAIVFNTPWNTRDIWLRARSRSPPSGIDLASLQLLVFHDEDVEIYFDGVLAARQESTSATTSRWKSAPTPGGCSSPARRSCSRYIAGRTDGGQGIDVGWRRFPPTGSRRGERDRLRGFAMSTPADVAKWEKTLLRRAAAGVQQMPLDRRQAPAAPGRISRRPTKFPRGADQRDPQSVGGHRDRVQHDRRHTKSGDAFVGVLKEANDDHLGVMGADGSSRTSPRRLCASAARRRRRSCRTAGNQPLAPGILRSSSNILVSLRLPTVADAGRQGCRNIRELPSPIALVPIHGENSTSITPAGSDKSRRPERFLSANTRPVASGV